MSLPNPAEQQPAYVLVVDDEGPNRYSVSKTLQRAGYIVNEAASGEDALEMVRLQEYDVVLTDIIMDGIDGIELLRRIKENSPDAIVILLTGYASLGSAVEALRLGAHDYLIKPSSSIDILQSVGRGVERARNLKRRRRLLDAIKNEVHELASASSGASTPIPAPDFYNDPPLAAQARLATQEAPNSAMKLGALTVYPGRYQASINDKPIDLTPTEFDLLLYLAAHQGRVVSCSELVREVRGYDVDEAEAREVIRPHVSNLRRKLKQVGQDEGLITNVRGIGYRLNDRGE
ncbi:MAG: response regulator transcription factor [Anaerolineae bacterium]|nr:response regulator transcription factor [Anaerolineae bacterium]MDW8171524.1 response regulator transcription factor [Anaerolineae bacterium]